MRGFNLSRFAVGHPTLILFFILMLGAAGAMSYLRLGRAEDPDFTIKVAIVSAQWPGATATEMRDQVVAIMRVDDRADRRSDQRIGGGIE